MLLERSRGVNDGDERLLKWTLGVTKTQFRRR